MKNCVFAISFTLFCFCTSKTDAQSITYNYDAGGNRISRHITVRHIKDRNNDEFDMTEIAENEENRISVRCDETSCNVDVSISGFSERDRFSISLYSLSGMRLRTIPGTMEKTEISLSDYPDGIYVIQVVLNGKNDTWKVVKR